MVALNRQTNDVPTQLHRAIFEQQATTRPLLTLEQTIWGHLAALWLIQTTCGHSA